jgi:hypothetical protein
MTSDLLSASILNATSKPNLIVRVTEAPIAMALEPLSHVGDGIFLQTRTAQGIATSFVWIALFITCQQVSVLFPVFFKIISNDLEHLCLLRNSRITYVYEIYCSDLIYCYMSIS